MVLRFEKSYFPKLSQEAKGMSFLLLPTPSPSGTGTGSQCPIHQVPQADLLLCGAWKLDRWLCRPGTWFQVRPRISPDKSRHLFKF